MSEKNKKAKTQEKEPKKSEQSQTKKPKVLTDTDISTLAEMYVGIERWKEYNEEEKDLARKVVLGMFDSLAKIGFEPRPIGQHIEARKRIHTDQGFMETYLKEWIVRMVTVPKNLIGIFPYQELAHNLIRDFKCTREE